MNRPSIHSASLLLGFLVVGAVSADDKIPSYACQGFDEPMNRPNIHIGRGRVLPLRGKLFLSEGKYGDDTLLKTAPVISLKYKPEAGPEVDKTAGVEVRDYGKGISFVFDKEAHWKFDLGTGNLPDDGKYVVSLLSGDPKEYKVDPPCKLTFLVEP
jgi:hypothetical protein